MHLRKSLVALCSAFTLGAVLAAAPVEAQGKGKNKGKGNKQKHAQVEQRASDRYGGYGGYDDYDRYDDRYSRDRYDVRYAGRAGNGSGKVPPGWCKGKGNKHNTRENCGYSGNRRYEDRDGYGRDRDRRDRDGYGRDRYGRSGSYEREHADFHHYLDRRYSDMAAQRPMDLRYQLELRMRKKAEHDQWHRETGIRH